MTMQSILNEVTSKTHSLHALGVAPGTSRDVLDSLRDEVLDLVETLRSNKVSKYTPALPQAPTPPPVFPLELLQNDQGRYFTLSEAGKRVLGGTLATAAGPRLHLVVAEEVSGRTLFFPPLELDPVSPSVTWGPIPSRNSYILVLSASSHLDQRWQIALVSWGTVEL